MRLKLLSLRQRGLTVAAGLLTTFVLVAGLADPRAVATPVIPDDLPLFPTRTVGENPRITVTFADGAPVAGRHVHRGDELLVHGTGFDPGANRGGFPLPVPPGIPNGLYVLYGGFPEQWRPSEGVPGSARTHPHDRMAWMMPAGTLAAVPALGNMRRSLAQVEQPLQADGGFVARIVVDPPERPTGDRFGIYVYPAAGSINAVEEIHLPLPFSPEPGPRTPPPSSPDLVVNATALERATRAAGGALTGTNGALRRGTDVSFTRASDEIAPDTGHGTIRFRGTAAATARFGLLDVRLRDPWIEAGPDGTFVYAEVSQSPDGGATDLRRVRIAEVHDPLPGRGATSTVRTSIGRIAVHR